jgi:hypothetical protein
LSEEAGEAIQKFGYAIKLRGPSAWCSAMSRAYAHCAGVLDPRLSDLPSSLGDRRGGGSPNPLLVINTQSRSTAPLCHPFHRDWSLKLVPPSTPSEVKILQYDLRPTASRLEAADAVVVEGGVDLNGING